MTKNHERASGAERMTAGEGSVSARTLAGMLRSRIERAAEHKSETVSLGQFFADQIHRYLTEAGHGPEHDARAGDVPADDGNPDRDRGRDWGLRARQVHLDALAKRAAGGKWFATTNGADGLARIDNGADGMFPVRGEWHEIEFIEALVNAYRSDELATPRTDSDEGTAAVESMRARKDAAYEERNKVVAALARLFPSGLKKTDIPGRDAEWHGAVYIDLPTGQVSWHFHDSQAHLFDGLPPYAGEWDGHDTPEKYARLAALATPAPSSPGVPDSVREAIQQNRPEAAEEALEWVNTLISIHPAGQSTGQGVETGGSVEVIERCVKLAQDAGLDSVTITGSVRHWQDIIAKLRQPAPDSPITGPVGVEDWRDEPSADERWCAGVDYAQKQLCHVLDIDPDAVCWDAATETLDGDIQAVICTILAAWGGDDWQALAARPAAPKAQGAWKSQAADDVLAERRRQVEVERFESPFDDRYARDELPTAAAIYAAPPSADWRPWLEKRWPWAPAWFKRSSRRRDLVKAGALILAEIERLDRLPAPPSSGQGGR